MNSFKSRFKNRHTLLAVVHVEGDRQALRNAKIAAYEGADGIFLINHSIPYTSLIECYSVIKQSLPKLWVGLNCLDLGRGAVEHIPKDTEGLWVDNAGIDDDPNSLSEARGFVKLRKRSNWNGTYFGGVAFKYQKEVSDVSKVARAAIPFVDVITTSGTGTGIAADLDKISLMKKAIGDHPLGLASGITPENVRDYMPHVDCFLVATGISDSHTELNPYKVRELVKALK